LNENVELFFDHINFELEKPGTGKILISEPFLPDPNFSRSVVLLTEHNGEGSVGFVLNRISEYTVGELVDDMEGFKAPVYLGGPVGLNQLFFIHTLGMEIMPNSKEIMEGLWWGGDFDQLKFYIDTGQVSNNDIRFFAGYSGWSKGQLQDEIREKSWIVAPTTREQVLMDAESYWKKVISGLGSRFRLMGNFPEDPSLN